MVNSDNENIKYKYRIKLDVKKDAWNWYVGCTRTPLHGNNWTERAPKEIVEIVQSKTEKEAYTFLMPYLKKKYVIDKEKIDKYTDFVKSEYDQKFQIACQKTVELLGKPIYRNDFTLFLSTFDRGPYNYHYGYTWIGIGWVDPIACFLHELMHFQFIHYWRKNPDSVVSKLSDEQFEYLKESLTIVLDEDFVPLIKQPDRGYEKHKELRLELKELWKSNKDFDKLVEFGVKRIPHYV